MGGPFTEGRIVIETDDQTHTLRLGPVVDGFRSVLDEAHPWAYRMAETDLQAFMSGG